MWGFSGQSQKVTFFHLSTEYLSEYFFWQTLKVISYGSPPRKHSFLEYLGCGCSSEDFSISFTINFDWFFDQWRRNSLYLSHPSLLGCWRTRAWSAMIQHLGVERINSQSPTMGVLGLETPTSWSVTQGLNCWATTVPPALLVTDIWWTSSSSQRPLQYYGLFYELKVIN